MITRANDELHNVDSYPDNYLEIRNDIRMTIDSVLAVDPLFNGVSFHDMENGYILVNLYSKDMGPHPLTHCYLDSGFQGLSDLLVEAYRRWMRDSSDEHKEYLKTYILRDKK